MLNKQQLEAVNCVGGPLLVLAGAGSGKTLTIARRIENMIRSGIPSDSILAVTFTRKASHDLKTRLSKSIGLEADRVHTGTFHSICTFILREDGAKLGLFDTDFTILANTECEQIMKNAIATKIVPEQADLHEMLRCVSMLKSELVGCHSFADLSSLDEHVEWNRVFSLAETIFPKEKFDLVRKVYELFQSSLLQSNALDFDDLIMISVILFLGHPDVLEKYQDRFRYIMIDEYQDTNRAQYVFAKLLSMKHRNIAVVGDDAQSIYSFRGSDIRNILSFSQDYPDAKVIKLEENYRCGPYILQAANEVISKNSNQTQKKLFTSKTSGEKIGYYCAHNEKDEARFVAIQTRQLAAKGYGFSNFAVLFRTKDQCTIFEEIFIKAGVPYQLSETIQTISPLLRISESKSEKISYEEKSANEQSVKLYTIHSAKGLEFHVVFLVGLEEGLFPHVKTLDLEEERRLFYVGITRAKDKLYFTHVERRTRRKKVKNLKPSRFLYDFNENLLDTTSVRPKVKS